METPDIYSKNGLNQLLNPENMSENPFKTGSQQTEEEKRGVTSDFARHPVLTNRFADLSRLDMPAQGPVKPAAETGQVTTPVVPGVSQSAQLSSPAMNQNPSGQGSPNSQLMDQMLGIMTNGAQLRLEFCSKVAALMIENQDIMEGIMGKISQVFTKQK